MSFQLRNYQETVKSQIYQKSSEGHQNILITMATGLGKTKLFTSIANEMTEYKIGIGVHRVELVKQISLDLAKLNVTHNIVAQKSDIVDIMDAHRKEVGKTYYRHGSRVNVLMVDTFLSRSAQYQKWAEKIDIWMIDEAAHLLKENKWGKSILKFKNSKWGLGFTACPQRLDGKGLGKHAQGVFDALITGPNTRFGIENGYLCNYKCVQPTLKVRDFLSKKHTSGDYTKSALRGAIEKAKIIGNIPETFEKYCKGLQTIAFVPEQVTGNELAEHLTKIGYTVAFLTAKTKKSERREKIENFTNKKVQVLINIDLFDEGLDIPHIECVLMLRATKSLSKYLQMIGRGLRVSLNKKYLLVVDMVGNISEHGLPDRPHRWTLDAVKKRPSNNLLIKYCSNPNCAEILDISTLVCPYCNTVQEKPGLTGTPREQIQQVDGDLILLDRETLMQLEEQATLESPDLLYSRICSVKGHGIAKYKAEKQTNKLLTQRELAQNIAAWAGVKKSMGLNDRLIHKAYYSEFGESIVETLGKNIDVMKQRTNKLKQRRINNE